MPPTARLPALGRRRPPAERLRGRPPPPPTLDDEPTLQLAIAREGIGLELSAPVEAGAVTIALARTRLLGLRFPLDVSGGVERFRHRRTALERTVLEIDAEKAERWLSTACADVLARGGAEARLATIDHDADPDGLRARRGELRIELAPSDVDDAALLGFDLTFAARDGGLVAYAHRLRGVGLPAAATALVGRVLARIAVALGARARGLRLELADPARAALVQAFVPRGARVPMREAVVLSALSARPSGWTLVLERGATARAPRPIATALAELDRRIGEADARLIDGDAEAARALYLRALEGAPRHKAILTRLADLDAAEPARAEAALGWLREAHKTRGSTSRDQDDNELGRTLLAASLHARTHAFGRARAGWERGGQAAFEDGESRLAARAWSLAAASCTDDEPQLASLLDRALAADPGESTARWRRARLRIRVGDDDGALEDVQHLEARAEGVAARRRTLLRCAALWAEAGRLEHAVPAYERALRHTPDDRDAVAGLGAALLAAGEIGRGVALMVEALAMPSPIGDDDGRAAVLLALATALAERVGDLPAAIGRLREIGADSPRATLARLLEGAYRLRLGDRPGATRALADGADRCERRVLPTEDVPRARERLLAAAAELRDGGDRELALRLALAAVTIAPHDEQALAEARALGHPAAGPSPIDDEALDDDDGDDHAESEGDVDDGHRPTPASTDVPPPFGLALDASPAPGDVAAIDDPALEARADALLARVKSDPDDDDAVDALVDVLSRLGRDFELFALLSARLDEASGERRVAMIPRQRAVLERLASLADANGRSMEATLYRDAASMLR